MKLKEYIKYLSKYENAMNCEVVFSSGENNNFFSLFIPQPTMTDVVGLDKMIKHNKKAINIYQMQYDIKKENVMFAIQEKDCNSIVIN